MFVLKEELLVASRILPGHFTQFVGVEITQQYGIRGVGHDVAILTQDADFVNLRKG